MKNIDKMRRIFCPVWDPDTSDEIPNKNNFDLVDYDEDNLRFCQTVFSPDPLTCNPQSEIAYMLSGSDEGFKQFLKERLFNPIPEGTLADSSDEAAALVKKNAYTPEQFTQVCRDYVTNMMREQQEGGA